MRDAPPKPVRFGDLGLRLASGLALAAIALIDIWLGGVWSVGLLAALLVVMLWEYDRLVQSGLPPRPACLPVAAIPGVVAVFSTYFYGPWAGVAAIALGCGLVALTGGRRRGWLVGGLLYMGLAVCAMVPLRHLEPNGLFFVIWLIVVVVSTDVGAYFVGRMVGGARLWPAVSPGKTRSGALGGLGFAALIGIPIGLWVGQDLFTSAFLSLGVSVASQCGDLLESAVKRRFGVKDASHIIPGHGGVMDRLDGVLGGVWFVAICGLLGVGSLG